LKLEVLNGTAETLQSGERVLADDFGDGIELGSRPESKAQEYRRGLGEAQLLVWREC
jgi:hypothetical protein